MPVNVSVVVVGGTPGSATSQLENGEVFPAASVATTVRRFAPFCSRTLIPKAPFLVETPFATVPATSSAPPWRSPPHTIASPAST